MVKRRPALEKVVDASYAGLRCRIGKGSIREEVWQDAAGKVVRYNLAFINHQMFRGDNGRVLGYDNAHGSEHRHFQGKTTVIFNLSIEQIITLFYDEVARLRETGEL